MWRDRLLLDMDGVISDYYKHACEYHGVPYKFKVPGNYSFENVGLRADNVWYGIGRDFWATMPKTPEADEIVDLVIRKYGLDNICLVTLYPTDSNYPLDKIADCYLGKMDWLGQHFPKLLKHFLIGPSKYFCAGLHNTLLDDASHNIETFIHWGGNGILLPRIWNNNHHLAHDPLGYLEQVLFAQPDNK